MLIDYTRVNVSIEIYLLTPDMIIYIAMYCNGLYLRYMLFKSSRYFIIKIMIFTNKEYLFSNY